MIETLRSSGFRNLTEAEITFSQKNTILVGENGQGKTNILEAVYLLSYGKTFRGEKSSAVSWGKDQALVEGKTSQDELKVLLRENGEHQVFINQKIKGLHEIFGKLLTVLFRPEEIELVSGQPSIRRAFLDKLISTLDRGYLFSLVSYNKALRNKNLLLKSKAPDEEVLPWNQILAREGAKIWQTRDNFMDRINQQVGSLGKKILSKSIEAKYKNPVQGEKNAQEKFFNLLMESRSRERVAGISFVGPHRDDFSTFVEEKSNKEGEKSLLDFGSRAEQRQGAVLLKLAQAEIFKESLQETPTLLLDDVSSELDKKNRDLLLSNVQDYQVLITTTDTDLIPESLKKESVVLKVSQGQITPE